MGLVAVTELFHLQDDLSKAGIERWLAIAADLDGIDCSIGARKLYQGRFEGDRDGIDRR